MTSEDKREQLKAARQATEAQEAGAAQRKRTVQYASLAVFAAVAVIVILVIVSQSGGGGSKTPSAPSNVKDVSQVSSQLSGLTQNANVLGDSSAPITIVEFGDPQCPVCQEFSEQVAPTLISTYVKTGQAKYEYRPWNIIGPQSPAASAAALAAGEQNRFWNYLQLFYRNQGEENSGYVTDSFLESIAKAAGVPDINKWNSDRDASKWHPDFTKNNSDADSLGFTGTPSILIEGPKGQNALSGFSLGEIQDAIKQQQG